MIIAIADSHLTALLAMREARYRWESECAGLGALAENRAWLAALTDSERAALDGWDADVEARLRALMASADSQPIATAREAQHGH